jgi:hypothetical protein
MSITLPFRYRFELVTDAVNQVATGIIHGTKNIIQSGIEFNPAACRAHIDTVAIRTATYSSVQSRRLARI